MARPSSSHRRIPSASKTRPRKLASNQPNLRLNRGNRQPLKRSMLAWIWAIITLRMRALLDSLNSFVNYYAILIKDGSHKIIKLGQVINIVFRPLQAAHVNIADIVLFQQLAHLLGVGALVDLGHVLLAPLKNPGSPPP